ARFSPPFIDAARPAYWVPDQDILSCHNCQRDFTAKLSKHHCRACGQGVCDDCSPERRPVPSRGWDHPVRVCILIHMFHVVYVFSFLIVVLILHKPRIVLKLLAFHLITGF
uniref:FYVE-type domain-containing protein n=1 Tax=Periophthalmus magnuspinnatus TaxID=409849 RepID=A0A3B4AQZ8_9GOBI